MAYKPYIPRADGAFDRWQQNFITYALANQKTLGLTQPEIDSLGESQRDWEKRYSDLTAARAACQSAVSLKTGSRADLERVLRQVAGRLAAEPSVTAAERAALGLTVADTVPTPVSAPATWPLLSIDTRDRLRHTVHFVDSATPAKKARPGGVIGVQLYLALRKPGEGAPVGPGAFQFAQLASRTPTVVEFEGSAAGMTAYYAARWTSTRAAGGPWGPISSATIGG